MQLSHERPDYAWVVRGADARHVRVNDRVLERSFALAPDPRTAQQTLLLGGNIVWLAALCGWFIGDLFRPSWAT